MRAIVPPKIPRIKLEISFIKNNLNLKSSIYKELFYLYSRLGKIGKKAGNTLAF